MGATSKLDMPRGLLIAALVAWALTWATDMAGALMTLLAAPLFGQPVHIPLDQAATLTGLYLVVGLPVAITTCFALGWPLWIMLDRRGVGGRRNAALTGAVLGLALALLVQGVGVLYGWQTALDENASYNSYSYGFQLIDDGLPTPLGWLLNMLDVCVTGLVGAVAGVAAWRFAQRRGAAPQTS
jgi:hypothetical protein